LPIKNIRFIGNIGVGKTTAICSLLGLKLQGVPILDTGAGRTTICDVKIRIWPGSPIDRIHVEIFDVHEFNDILDLMINKPHLVSTEQQFAIRNIIRLTGDNYNKAQLRFNNPRNFKIFCIERAQYTRRNRNSVEMRSNCADGSKKWINNNFHLINTGCHSSFGLPKTISIHLSNKFDQGKGNFWDNTYFIDTKGIDANYSIQNNIRQIEVYCTSFVNGPERNIVQLITDSNNHIRNKYIMILPKYDEPEDVNGADGCYDTGIHLKINEFKKATRNIINGDNIFVHDSLKDHSTKPLYSIF
jgi:hypothetical protein